MSSKYIHPDNLKESFTCPHCGTLSLMHYSVIEYPYPGYKPILDAKDMKRGTGWVQIAICHNCKQKTIWIDNIYIYPDIVAETPNNDMPESVKQLYNEAALIYNKSPRAACALLRLAIDRLCDELGETDGDLNNKIGALVEKGLPKLVQQALDVVRVIGNKAVHPGQIAFDVDDKDTAVCLMHLLNIIVERMISEPKEIGVLFQYLPDSAKKSIQKRDGDKT